MAFDPAGAVRFDLGSGTVRSSDEGRVVLVPVEALAEIARSAPQAIGPVGQAIGAAMRGPRPGTERYGVFRM